LPSLDRLRQPAAEIGGFIVAISRGGFYGSGTPAAVGEHLETYLRWVFGFIGIRNPEFISADGGGLVSLN
jgi:FMN-dependent NADH-azoreductase